MVDRFHLIFRLKSHFEFVEMLFFYIVLNSISKNIYSYFIEWIHTPTDTRMFLYFIILTCVIEEGCAG